MVIIWWEISAFFGISWTACWTKHMLDVCEQNKLVKILGNKNSILT